MVKMLHWTYARCLPDEVGASLHGPGCVATLHWTVCEEAYAASETGACWRLAPWGEDTRYYKGHSHAVEVALPGGYRVAEHPTLKTPWIVDAEARQCRLTGDRAAPAIITASGRVLPLAPLAFGEAVRALRDRAGLTQAQAGEVIGRDGNTIARWERGEVCPDALVRDAALDRLRQAVPARG